MHSDIIDRLFSAVDKKDVQAYLGCFTEDAEYRAGNFPAVKGHQGIIEFSKPMLEMFSNVTHNVKNVWQSGDIVCCELDLTYVRRKDGKVVTVPCCDVIRLEGGKVKSLRAFLDASPAFV
jgi:ketosteroid isomerase-like protein